MRAIRRHPWIVATVMLAMLLGAGVWLLVRSPPYTASAQVLVTPAPYYDPTYLGLADVIRDTPADPFRAVETGATMLDSPSAAAAAARRLGAGWSPGRVQAMVTVTAIGATNVVEIQASAARSGVAAGVANAFAEASLAIHGQVLRAQALNLVAQLRESPHVDPTRIANLRAVSGGIDPTFSLLHEAVGPGVTVAPGVPRVITIVLLAGLVLGTGAAFLTDVAMRRRLGKGAGSPERTSVVRLPTPPDELPVERRRQDDRPQA